MHKQLIEKSEIYKSWHENALSEPFHWFMFLFFVFSMTNLVVGDIDVVREPTDQSAIVALGLDGKQISVSKGHLLGR